MKNHVLFIILALTSVGFVSCQNQKGDSVEEKAPVETVATTAGAEQIFHVLPGESTIHWEGYKPAMGTTHTGTVQVSEGKLGTKDGMITGGSFTIDFTTIENTDLEGASKDKLEAHLKGTAQGKEDDFFNVAKYPTGKFEITKVTELQGDAEANAMIYGNLTMKGITKNIGFKANVQITDGSLKATTPLFMIDRTEWGIKVLSKKFFENLQDNFVSDEFGIRIELRANTARDI